MTAEAAPQASPVPTPQRPVRHDPRNPPLRAAATASSATSHCNGVNAIHW